MERRNVGPPWRRQSGELVPHGGVFTPTVREEQSIQDQQLDKWLQPVLLAGLPVEAAQQVVQALDPAGVVAHLEKHQADITAAVEKAIATHLPKPAEEWPLRITPEQYLARYPNARLAKLAQAWRAYEKGRA